MGAMAKLSSFGAGRMNLRDAAIIVHGSLAIAILAAAGLATGNKPVVMLAAICAAAAYLSEYTDAMNEELLSPAFYSFARYFIPTLVIVAFAAFVAGLYLL